jgi:YHS domain-containing protein
MKSLILSAALLVLTLGCNDKSQPPDQSSKAAMPTTAPATQASATLKPINKYCAVNRDEEIDPTVTTVYNGKVIGFCCDDCIPKFKKDPEKYMKDLK